MPWNGGQSEPIGPYALLTSETEANSKSKLSITFSQFSSSCCWVCAI
uniref:Uncharacterized protein n=1 Tax=Arundo donax TaxID=35708 RepID=A0A0A9A8F4_ARUDO